jgi:putative transposase
MANKKPQGKGYSEERIVTILKELEIGKTIAAKYLREKLGRSERHACRAVGISRSALHYKPKPDEERLREEVKRLASENRRYGCRRITALLRRELCVNRKRVHRIWKDEGLGLKRKRPLA